MNGNGRNWIIIFCITHPPSTLLLPVSNVRSTSKEFSIQFHCTCIISAWLDCVGGRTNWREMVTSMWICDKLYSVSAFPIKLFHSTHHRHISNYVQMIQCRQHLKCVHQQKSGPWQHLINGFPFWINRCADTFNSLVVNLCRSYWDRTRVEVGGGGGGI